ncbi:hypothetical protein D3C86_1858300 [compost metagenome]
MAEYRVGFQYFHDLVGSHKRSDRHSSAHSLGAEQDIGIDSKLFEGPEAACTPKARLNFIQNQQSTGLGTFLT